MPSIVPGFEYDIFISYRHNDNRSGWVTEFVGALQEELASTIKEPLTIYFDRDPHDGLLETHNVDKSLEGKLRCLVFIPIVSQTYSDTKCFAWQHEFCAFNKSATADQFGIDIKLRGGNVASRILPVKIHDLDAGDKANIENELSATLRGIEFIYREPGVNRPLKSIDSKSDNQNKTDYRNQMNKVANSIKELMIALQGGPSVLNKNTAAAEKQTVSQPIRRKMAIAGIMIGSLGVLAYLLFYFGGFKNWLAQRPEKSIAVLPFENMNHDPEQDYFSNGITEDILNHLVKIADLKVKSRTSTLQYKGTQKTITEVGEELGVATILDGSVRRVGDRVRVVVQLIDTRTDTHVWSETYDRQLKDVLALQSEIAIEIANALRTQLTPVETENIKKIASRNIEAYDLFLKAKEIGRKPNLERRNFDIGFKLVNEAIRLDPGFARAYALKGLNWYYTRYLGVSQRTWEDSAIFYSSKAIALDPNSPDGYLVQARVYEVLGDFNKTKAAITRAYTLAPNDPEALDAYGYQLLGDRNEMGADLVLKSLERKFSAADFQYYLWLGDIYRDIQDYAMSEDLFQKSKVLEPTSIMPYWRLADLFNDTKQYEKGIREGEMAEKITSHNSQPGSEVLNTPGIPNILGWLHFNNNNLEMAAHYWSKYPEVEAQFDDTTQFVPYRHNLAMVYSKMGRKKEADALVVEDLKKQMELRNGKRGLGVWEGMGAAYYDIAVDHTYMGHPDIAMQYLDSAIRSGFFFPGYRTDPLLDNLRNRDDFKRLLKKVDNFYEFRKVAFTKALNRWQPNKELKTLLK